MSPTRCAFVLFLALIIGNAFASERPSSPKALKDRPNVLLIVSDDQTYRDFGFMGNADVHTPNLDRLASSSVRFPNGYVPTSVCSPSLATLLTGLYPHQHRIHYNHPPPGNRAFNQMRDPAEYERVRSESFARIRELPTLPRLLATAGYRSLQTGKFWEGHFSNAGFSEGMSVFEPVPGQTFGGNRTLDSGELAAHGNGDFGLKIGRQTMAPIDAFIDKAEADDVPWFVWFAPYLPHAPHDAPQRFFDVYKEKSGIPKHVLPYYASIARFDKTVGHLLDGLERRSLLDQTLIVFVVDNGWTPGPDGQHTKESKRAPFDDGLRTPILLRHDGRLAPREDATLASSVDLMPTILNACGVDSAPLELPGRDLLAGNLGPRPVFGEIYPGDASALGHPERDIAYRWIREGDLKLITRHRHGNAKRPWGGYLEGDALFNLRIDPGEKQNLIDEPARSVDATRLRKKLDAWWTPEIALFNGTDLSGFTTWLVDSKTDDPREVFGVRDGALRISGDGFGYLATGGSYRHYALLLEYRWGDQSGLDRRHRTGKALDSGVFLHATGPDGNSHDGNGAYMAAIECNLFEGASGDFLLIRGTDDDGNLIAPQLRARSDGRRDADGFPSWIRNGDDEVSLERWGRLNWSKKSAFWEDRRGFRGRRDVESPVGEWNRLECECRDGSIEIRLNGETINRAHDVYPREGKILLQCEGAEIFFRKLRLRPM